MYFSISIYSSDSTDYRLTVKKESGGVYFLIFIFAEITKYDAYSYSILLLISNIITY
jgi:hypothetical protein